MKVSYAPFLLAFALVAAGAAQAGDILDSGSEDSRPFFPEGWIRGYVEGSCAPPQRTRFEPLRILDRRRWRYRRSLLRPLPGMFWADTSRFSPSAGDCWDECISSGNPICSWAATFPNSTIAFRGLPWLTSTR